MDRHATPPARVLSAAGDAPASPPLAPDAPPAAPDAPGTAPTTAIVATDAQPPALDAHGFDPNDYDWVPVRRKPRPDGWSAEKQRLFITTLADTGSVTAAARECSMSVKSAYALRRAPDGEGFARAWSAAVRQGMNRLIDVCLERAIEGSYEPVFDRDGQKIGSRFRQHDRMAMFLLRAHMPELFRDAHKADRARGEALPPPPEPVAEAVKRIGPVEPAEPHALMPPDDLATALECADLLDGALPPWRRDPDLLAQERAARRAAADAAADPDAPVLGEAFERALEEAKAGTWTPPGPKRRRRRRV